MARADDVTVMTGNFASEEALRWEPWCFGTEIPFIVFPSFFSLNHQKIRIILNASYDDFNQLVFFHKEIEMEFSRTVSLTLSHTQTDTRILAHALFHYWYDSLSLSFTHTCPSQHSSTHTSTFHLLLLICLTIFLTISPYLSLAHSLCLFFSHTLFPPHTLTHTHALSLAYTRSCPHMHTHSQTRWNLQHRDDLDADKRNRKPKKNLISSSSCSNRDISFLAQFLRVRLRIAWSTITAPSNIHKTHSPTATVVAQEEDFLSMFRLKDMSSSPSGSTVVSYFPLKTPRNVSTTIESVLEPWW